MQIDRVTCRRTLKASMATAGMLADNAPDRVTAKNLQGDR